MSMINLAEIKSQISLTDSILQVRRTGRTTKLANFFIQQLIAMGECFPADHYPGHEATRNMMELITTILTKQYPLLKGCIIQTDKSLKINRDAYLKNVETFLSSRI